MREIPRRFEHATVTSDSTGWNPIIYETVASYLQNLDVCLKQGKGMLLVGSSGTGKSYAAAAALNTIRQFYDKNNLPEPGIAWAPVGECLDRLMMLRDFRQGEYHSVDYALKLRDFVVFDDFGHLRDYDRLRELFWIYVNARYDRMLPTFFTANLDLDESWSSLDKLFGAHFRRRIQAMTEGYVAVV